MWIWKRKWKSVDKRDRGNLYAAVLLGSGEAASPQFLPFVGMGFNPVGVHKETGD